MEKTLKTKGVPYDVVEFDLKSPPSGGLKGVLYDAKGAPKYAGIIMLPDMEGAGGLSRADVSDGDKRVVRAGLPVLLRQDIACS